MKVIATIAEARVASDRCDDLVARYRTLMKSEHGGLIVAALMRQRDDPTVWQRVALWEDVAAIDQRRRSGARGIASLFREVGAEPRVVVYDVIDSTWVSR